MGPLEELRTAVEDAAADAAQRQAGADGRGRRSSGPKKAGFGDYSTNAAMLLAPALGAPPRDDRRAARPARCRGRLGERVDARRGGRARASSTSSSPTTGSRARSRTCSPPASAFGAGTPRAARAGARRVRLRQPDRAADRRQRPPRRVRRRAGADPRARRPQRQPRVLLQRPRLADRPPRRVDPRPRPRRGPAGGRLPGRLRRRARARRSRAPPTRDAGRAGRSAASSRSWPGIRAHARAPTACSSTTGSSSAASTRASPSAVERTLALLEEHGPHLPLRGRAVAAHHGVRRRQGPRARALDAARRPTSPTTSPTTRTSSSAATTA